VAYIGNDLAVAYPSYRNIDDISASFNGSTTSFALLVNGTAPVPQPLNSQQCLISVGGVLQRPDDTGSEGFRLSGGNIIFSSAPSISEDFFGVVLAGADYVNVGANFPDGQVGAPSITFDQDTDTGFYRSGSGAVSFTSNGVGTATFGSASFIAPSFIPTSSTVPTNGVYLPAANSVAISTNSTERTRIDSSGRLLVGTSTSNAPGSINSKIQVEALDFTGSFSAVRNSVDTGGPVLLLGKSRGTSLGAKTIVTSGDSLGSINFFGADGTNFVEGASIGTQVDGTPGTNDMPGRLVFSTTADGASSPTERMRIHSTGNVSFTSGAYFGGTTDQGAFVVISGGIIASGAGTNAVKWNGTNGRLTYDTSSKLIKEQIVDCPYGIDAIKHIKPRKYFRIDDQKEEIGFVADELAEILPELVPMGSKSLITKNDEDTEEIPISVNYDRLTAVLTKALQEAISKIETLEAKVAALEGV
jgi:hypothetical protein